MFLAGDRALKVKRAVQFPFLDYSTLEKRKAACEAELSVNAPYAPEIYHGVVPITRDPDGKFAIAGSGTPAEWAVEMQRFDEKRTLDHLAGEIDEAQPTRSAAPSPRRMPRHPRWGPKNGSQRLAAILTSMSKPSGNIPISSLCRDQNARA